MFTVGQLIAHGVGDYLLQSEWMAREKTRRCPAARVHAVLDVLPFLSLIVATISAFGSARHSAAGCLDTAVRVADA